MNRKYTELLLGLFAALAAFVVYILTLAPTVWFIDSGELASVASTLGIAHPTGYPLFTIVGHIFTLLPFSSSEVYKLNVMSAFFCSLGVFVFFYLMKFLFANRSAIVPAQQSQNKQKKTSQSKTTAEKRTEQLPDIVVYGILVFSGLVLAFSQTYWDTANAVEVYPIHCFFVPVLMLVFLKAIMKTKVAKEPQGTADFIRENRDYVLFAFLLGLSFTNHMTTILLAPACLTLFIVVNFSDRKRMYRLLVFMALAFIISFSLYLYLPLRAAQHPVFMWGNPYNFERFMWHITGKQFSVWIFSAKGSIPVFIILLGAIITLSAVGLKKQRTLSGFYHFGVFLIISILVFMLLTGTNETVAAQFKKFWSSLGNEYGAGLVILGIIGAYRLSKYNLTIYYFTLLTFFGCIVYSVNYDIHDIDSYFLLAYITMVIWIGFGVYLIAEAAYNSLRTKGSQIGFAVLIVLVTILPLKTNWEANDESKNYFVEQFTMNILKNAEPNGMIISSQWDFWVSASWYFKYVKKMRPDVIVIDKELLRRSWYFTFIEQNYPEIYNNSRPEIERFLAELYKFEHDIPYDTKTIMKLFSEMLTSFVANNPSRKIYTTWEIEQNKDEQFAQDFMRIPDGLIYLLVKKENVKNNILPDYKTYDFSFTPTSNPDYYHKTMMTSYALMLTQSASFLLANNRPDEARKYIDLALLAIPNYPQAVELKKKNNL
jgi:hypothetical protein